MNIDCSVMKPGPDLAGKEKGSADPHGPDGIQLIGVEENLRLERFRPVSAPEAVRFDAVDNQSDFFRRDAVLIEDGRRQLGAFLSVTNSAP